MKLAILENSLCLIAQSMLTTGRRRSAPDETRWLGWDGWVSCPLNRREGEH